jgi:hypothetical protein
VTGDRLPRERLTTGQVVTWTVVFTVVVALLVLFFIYGRQVRPLLNL